MSSLQDATEWFFFRFSFRQQFSDFYDPVVYWFFPLFFNHVMYLSGNRVSKSRGIGYSHLFFFTVIIIVIKIENVNLECHKTTKIKPGLIRWTMTIWHIFPIFKRVHIRITIQSTLSFGWWPGFRWPHDYDKKYMKMRMKYRKEDIMSLDQSTCLLYPETLLKIRWRWPRSIPGIIHSFCQTGTHLSTNSCNILDHLMDIFMSKSLFIRALHVHRMLRLM